MKTCWAQHLFQKVKSCEQEGCHPAGWVLRHYGPNDIGKNNLEALRVKMSDIMGSPLSPIAGTFPADFGDHYAVTLPIDAFVVTRARQGDNDDPKSLITDLPRLEQWLNTFMDILGMGYQMEREPMKVKRANHYDKEDIAQGSVEVVKGFTRLTIMLYSLHHGIAFMETALESMAIDHYQHDYTLFRACPGPRYRWEETREKERERETTDGRREKQERR